MPVRALPSSRQYRAAFLRLRRSPYGNGYASQPPANPLLVCGVLWTKERGQRALLGLDLELVDVEHEHRQKQSQQFDKYATHASR